MPGREETTEERLLAAALNGLTAGPTSRTEVFGADYWSGNALLGHAPEGFSLSGP